MRSQSTTKFFRVASLLAANKEYLEYISGAATAMNCLLNVQEWRLCKALKQELSSLFNRLASILPDNFRLNLFESGEEFGWRGGEQKESSEPSPPRQSPWFNARGFSCVPVERRR